MDALSDIIGILIVLFLFLFPMLKKIVMKKADSQDEKPPVVKKRREGCTPLKPHTTERLLKNDFEFESDLDKRHLGTRIDPKIDDQIVSPQLEPPAVKSIASHSFFSKIGRRPLVQQMVIFRTVLERLDDN